MASDVAYVDNYDVFINFRGADTRKGFVKILYDDLVGEGMRVFLDDEKLNYGKRLDEELPQAINNSKIYITVISETYASSKWCLRELAEIAKNKQQFKEKKEILPVFYKIKTDDVKLKTDLLKNQLNSLINKTVRAQTVDEWVMALKGIADLKAWKVPTDGGYKEDAECCREIVKRASISLRVKHKPLPKDLIGMEDPVEDVIQLLNIGNPDLHVIGIHGMGGSGKTTLAKAVYNKLCDKFDTCCFLPNVRESLDNEKGSKAYLELQKKLLKEVSTQEDGDEITDVDVAVRKIQLTLEGKKVLMVFDDVSKPDQVVRLIGDNYTMFGRESRIVITTRDDRVVRNRDFAKFTKIHEMKAMKIEHALELFSWHAFGELTAPEGYSLLSKDAVSLTGRLPLSLVITGSLFFVGGRNNWEQTVEKLKKMPNEDVQERLKISYQDLEEGTREIFLDIACFFVDKERSHEFYMWDACGFFPELAIQELISMCLVKIDDYGKYWMHDHIKDLGREIVRQEGPKDKEQCSRIWNNQDAIDILTASRKEENKKIEGILLEGIHHNVILTLKGEDCINLDKLRFLHLEDSIFETLVVQLEGSFENFLQNLRWLSLPYMKTEQFNMTNFFCFWRFNATNFNLKKLVILILSHSDIAESWAMFTDLPCLEVLDLSYCLGLKKTPNLSNCRSLKKLLLPYCSNLEEIDCSITTLPKLQHLDLSECSNLQKLTDSEKELEVSLFGGCVDLDLPSLEVLNLTSCESLRKIPDLSYCKSLKELLLSYCSNLEEIDMSITTLPKLRHLDLSFCRKITNLPNSIGELVELEVLSLCACTGLVSLPNSLTNLPKLHILRVNGCRDLESLPDSVGEMIQLTELDISALVLLKKLPGFIFKQRKLEFLCADFIQMQGVVPMEIGELNCLREMSLNGSSICGLPSLVKLTSLVKLSLMSCNQLQQLPAQLPTSLVQLHVSSSSLQSIPDYSYLIHLSKLELDLCECSGDGEVQELNLNWIWRLSKLKGLLLRIPKNFTTTIQSEESPSVNQSHQLEELGLSCSVLGICVIPRFLYALRALAISLYRETTTLSLPRLNCLTHFYLLDSDDLAQILGLGELESLIKLKIMGCHSLERLDDISKLRQLQTLEITECKKLRVIHVVLCLRSLKELEISECESLESLVGESESRLDDLHLVENLKIVNCPLLEKKLPDGLKCIKGKYRFPFFGARNRGIN